MLNTTTPVSKRSRTMVWVAITTVLLVALSDVLLFDADTGINVFLVAFAIASATLALAWRRRRFRQGLIGWVTALVLSFPLFESVTLISLALSAFGLGLAALIAGRMLPRDIERMPSLLLRFLVPAPIRLVRDAATLRPALNQHWGRKAARWLVAWVVPLCLSAVFLNLFAAANPLIETVLSAARPPTLLSLIKPNRMMFWLALAACIWAVLRPKLLRSRHQQASEKTVMPDNSTWLGSAAIFRSLLVFNALFAIQTSMDLVYLWGGVALPEGMSHAEYAHRGAYPLIVTALLAGAFVLVAMRERSPVREDRIIKALVYLFIVQNVLLCLSAMLRLKLYVEVYYLTELRLVAGIWMGLVAVGLVLIIVRIWLRRSNGFLVATNLLSLTVVLYASAMVDLSSYIARFNVEHSLELTGEGMSADLDYLRELGPSAIPAIDGLIAQLVLGTSFWARAVATRSALAGELLSSGRDLRGWSWRTERLKHYLAIQEVVSAPPTRHNERVSGGEVS